MSEIPTRLSNALADHYTIERELGVGGMATVYLADDLKHGRKVAIKVLKPDLAAVIGPDRFLREIQIAAQLNHPHILPLYDSGEADGFLYYVMPRIEGKSLRELVSGMRGDFASTVEDLRKAIRLDEDNAYYWCQLAWACNSKNPAAPADGETAAREAVRLHPGYFWSHITLGKALSLQARFAEAAESYEFAAQLEPAFRHTHLELGGMYVALERYDDALRTYEAAGELGETAGLHATIGGVHAVLGHTESALAELERAFETGFRDFAAIEGSPHYRRLADDERFRSLIERYRSRE